MKESVNSNHFKVINNDYVNEIANKSCKKKTHKQTTWAVEALKGKFLLKVKIITQLRGVRSWQF